MLVLIRSHNETSLCLCFGVEVGNAMVQKPLVLITKLCGPAME